MMRFVPALALASALVLAPAGPAWAQVTSIDDNDQKLYLNQSPPLEWGGMPLNNVASRFYQPGGFFVSKGKIRLTPNQLFDHLEQAQVAPEFVEKGRRELGYENVLNTSTYGLLALSLTCSYLSLTDQARLGLVLAGVGVVTAAGGLAGAVTKLVNPPKLPSADDTVKALRAYNATQAK